MDEQQTVEAWAGLQTDLHLQVVSQTSPACVFIKEMEYAELQSTYSSQNRCHTNINGEDTGD